MGIGWVMFWKAVIVGLFSIFSGWWAGQKAKRRLTLRQDKRGVYVPDNRLERIERFVIRATWTGVALVTAVGFWLAFSIPQ